MRLTFPVQTITKKVTSVLVTVCCAWFDSLLEPFFVSSSNNTALSPVHTPNNNNNNNNKYYEYYYYYQFENWASSAKYKTHGTCS